VYLDPSTKWPRKGKAVEHAQQKVKTGAPACAPKGRPNGRFGQGNQPSKNGHFGSPVAEH
jgi:hypothetical protein